MIYVLGLLPGFSAVAGFVGGVTFSAFASSSSALPIGSVSCGSAAFPGSVGFPGSAALPGSVAFPGSAALPGSVAFPGSAALPGSVAFPGAFPELPGLSASPELLESELPESEFPAFPEFPCAQAACGLSVRDRPSCATR
ncbi:MAG: hypothetical protein EOR08_23660 [Mesorhizobium sp.]|nr:MAG: hypothetical protein EOR08_23660 [Mesorhizobium sp.]